LFLNDKMFWSSHIRFLQDLLEALVVCVYNVYHLMYAMYGVRASGSLDVALLDFVCYIVWTLDRGHTTAWLVSTIFLNG